MARRPRQPAGRGCHPELLPRSAETPRLDAKSRQNQQIFGHFAPPNPFADAHCSGNNAHFTGNNVRPPGNNAHPTRNNVHRTGNNAHFSGNNVRCSWNNAHFTGNDVRCPGNNAHCTGNKVHCSRNNVHCSVLDAVPIVFKPWTIRLRPGPRRHPQPAKLLPPSVRAAEPNCPLVIGPLPA